MLHGANRLIAGLLPNRVAVAEGLIADYQPDLWPEETAYVANAVEKRRREFACGRHFVRSCLRALGRPDEPLPVRADRSPRWPDGLVGSITHTDTYCAAAVARTDDVDSIGIDVEDLSRFEPELLQYVLSRGDVTRNFLGTSGIDCSLGAALFSAKETFYKCLAGLAQAQFDYGDVGIEFIDGSDVFYGRLLRPVGRLSVARAFIGRYVVVGDQVATAMILPRQGSDIRA
jgi:4'-phosphopantetheinyl transferase EntD